MPVGLQIICKGWLPLILMHDIHMLNYEVADSVVLRKKKPPITPLKVEEANFMGIKNNAN